MLKKPKLELKILVTHSNFELMYVSILIIRIVLISVKIIIELMCM